jgi:hypothetical protein
MRRVSECWPCAAALAVRRVSEYWPCAASCARALAVRIRRLIVLCLIAGCASAPPRRDYVRHFLACQPVLTVRSLRYGRGKLRFPFGTQWRLKLELFHVPSGRPTMPCGDSPCHLTPLHLSQWRQIQCRCEARRHVMMRRLQSETAIATARRRTRVLHLPDLDRPNAGVQPERGVGVHQFIGDMYSEVCDHH